MCYGLYIHSNYPELFESEYIEYFGEDCATQFVKHVEQLQEIFYTLLQTNTELIMTEENQTGGSRTVSDEQDFQNSRKCYYCNKELKKDRVIDHDYLNGKFRGAKN